MRLRSASINRYNNLRDFLLACEDQEFIGLLVGNDGEVS
jgi:hypothetical protein